MISPQEALSLVLSHCRLQPIETVALDQAVGRVLAQPVRADRDSPPADRSAMDGYAVRAADLAQAPRELRLVGEVAAGSPSRPRVKPGTCARILTGANVPPGADAIAIVETTEETGPGVIRFRDRVMRGQYVLRRGENTRRGHVLLEPGIRLGPQQIAVCAAFGAERVRVFVTPRVGVLCTGKELVGVSGRVARHAQRDSNGPALRAALQTCGLARCGVCGVVDDDPRVLRRRIRAALKTCDVLILVGGVSVGKYDCVPAALTALDCRTIFHGVSVKPGKPNLFAVGPGRQRGEPLGKGKGKGAGAQRQPLVFGLPGNPLSAVTGFYEFVLPALRVMTGLTGPPLTRIRVCLEAAVKEERCGRTRLVPARLRFDPDDDTPLAYPIEMHSSADVVAGGHADGVVVLPEERAYEAGSLVEFHPWGEPF